MGRLALRDLQEKGQKDGSDGPEWQVDIDYTGVLDRNRQEPRGRRILTTPSPSGRAVGKGASHQRGDDACHPKHSGDYGLIGCSLGQGDRVDGNDDGPSIYASAPQTGDGTTHDEGGGRRGGTTHYRADLEDQDADEENDLDAVEGIQSSKHELEGAGGHEVRRGIPADVGHGVELVRYSGDCGRYDEAVL
jgi:hypothetical protein